jgi:hypothetical protein
LLPVKAPSAVPIIPRVRAALVLPFFNFHSAKLMILKGHTKEILLINVNYKIIVLKYLKIISMI